MHVVAAVGTLVLLRGGSEAVADVGQRVAYVSQHAARWRAGWLLWMLAAQSLAGFYAWWGNRAAVRTALVALVCAGVAVYGVACLLTRAFALDDLKLLINRQTRKA
jgi:hypothetical protein